MVKKKINQEIIGLRCSFLVVFYYIHLHTICIYATVYILVPGTQQNCMQRLFSKSVFLFIECCSNRGKTC